MNLFMLFAPYQYMNARELIHNLRLVDNRLVIVNQDIHPLPHFHAVIEAADWASVEMLNVPLRKAPRDFGMEPARTASERLEELALLFNRWANRRESDRFARRMPRVDNLVLGHYRMHTPRIGCHLANLLSYRHLYVLDPGSDVLRVARRRRLEIEQQQSASQDPGRSHHPAPAKPAVPKPWKRWKRALRKRYVDWIDHPVSQITFFSSYNLEIQPPDRLIRNDYVYHRKLVAQKPRDESVAFVSQPLADQGYVSFPDFVELLRSVRRYFFGRHLLYYRHPRESDGQLTAARELGFEIRQNVAPFEHEVCQGNSVPRTVATFFSSVAENCAAIFRDGLEIVALRLPAPLLCKNHEEVESLYAHLASHAGGLVTVVEPSVWHPELNGGC
jgi:hypothetical protein